MAVADLHDTRTGQNTQHSLPALLRQSIYSRLAGYEDVNDARTPGPRSGDAGGGRRPGQGPPGRFHQREARFETDTLSTEVNLRHLMDLSGQWVGRAHRRRQLDKLVLDVDSSVSETYGHQEGSAYNGYFGCTCYHPLFLFNQFGDPGA